jgi:hypothetical protein
MIEGNTKNTLPKNPKMEKQMKIKRALLTTLSAMLLPASVMAQVIDIDPAEGTAVFVVQKIFSDRNDETAVTLHMDCTSGNPTEQERTVVPGPGQLHGQFEVAFVLDNIPTDTDEVNCTIYEEPVAGYSAEYRCFGVSDSEADDSCIDNPGDQSPLATECIFNAVEVGDANLCAIRNIPNPAEIEITKEWVVEGSVGNNLDFEARIEVRSTDYFDEAHQCGGNQFCRYVTFDKGPGSESKTLTVYPTFEGATIWVYEDIYDSTFDSDNDCDNTMHVMPAGYQGASGEDSCTFTNTAYFEGIPTLNQYGMAIMALLMLGVGFIGFRRFV